MFINVIIRLINSCEISKRPIGDLAFVIEFIEPERGGDFDGEGGDNNGLDESLAALRRGCDLLPSVDFGCGFEFFLFVPDFHELLVSLHDHLEELSGGYNHKVI